MSEAPGFNSDTHGYGRPSHLFDCPDGGACHHSCSAPQACFRVDFAEPLSAAGFPGNKWPAEILAAHLPTDGTL